MISRGTLQTPDAAQSERRLVLNMAPRWQAAWWPKCSRGAERRLVLNMAPRWQAAWWPEFGSLFWPLLLLVHANLLLVRHRFNPPTTETLTKPSWIK